MVNAFYYSPKFRTQTTPCDTALVQQTEGRRKPQDLSQAIAHARCSTIPALTGYIHHFLSHYFIELFPPIQIDVVTGFLNDQTLGSTAVILPFFGSSRLENPLLFLLHFLFCSVAARNIHPEQLPVLAFPRQIMRKD